MSAVGVVVELTVRRDRIDEFLVIAREHAAASLAGEEGCLRFEVMRPQGSPDRVFLVELYRDGAALESHWRSPHLNAYRERIKDMLINRVAHRCDVLE